MKEQLTEEQKKFLTAEGKVVVKHVLEVEKLIRLHINYCLI